MTRETHFDKKVNICVMVFENIKVRSKNFYDFGFVRFIYDGFALRCAEFCYVKRN